MDVAAVLRCWPVVVPLGDSVYDIPALPAADWVAAIAERDVLAIVPGLMAAEDEAVISDLLAFGEVSPDELVVAARDAMEAAAGRPWWEVYRLVLAAAEHADSVLGWLTVRGVDFTRVSLGAFCAAVVAVATQGMDQKDRMKFAMDLKMVPLEVAAEADDDVLAEAFLQAMKERPAS